MSSAVDFAHICVMKDWAIDYIQHVLETKDWSANRLASEAGVASSTIARPLRERENYAGKLSRTTINKIWAASGIDPSSFIPKELREADHVFTGRPETQADRSLASLDAPPPEAPARNVIKVAVVGDLAQIVATVDKKGLIRLREKLDAIETMLDD